MKVSTIVAALVGAVVMFLLGWLFFGVLLSSYMEANIPKAVKDSGMMRAQPEFICLFLFNLVWAWLLAIIFDYWAGVRDFIRGAKIGALIMFLLALGVNLQYCAFMNYHDNWTMIIIDILVVAVMGAITGGVMGLVLGYFNKPTTTETAG